MDFFASQDHARRATRRLVVLFALAVVLLIASIYVAALLIFGRDAVAASLQAGSPLLRALWRPELLVAVSAATLLIVASGSGWKISQLSRGGPVVAEMLGGRPVSPATDDPDERRLLNVVEEMSLASGIPVPAVYLLDGEHGINAFAAGYSQSDAVIGVTRGTMELLTRDELQGVIGHELSHVLNGDMRLNLRLIGVIHGILVISLIGYSFLRASGGRRGGSKRDGGGAIVLFGLALYLLGFIGVVFGKLIRAAVSRQREYLADGAAVQFTRNPDGLSGALKKIGGLAAGSKVESPKALEASHLFFANALTSAFSQMMATHPPLVDRVRRLEPGFDGRFPVVEPRTEREEAQGGGEPETSRDRLRQIVRPAILAGAGAAAAGTVGQGSIVDHVGELSEQHIEHAAALIAALPAELRDAVHEPAAAEAVVLALLLDPADEIRERQIAFLHGRVDPPVASELHKLAPAVARAAREARLPLVDLAIPALKQMSAAQYDSFKATVRALIESDQQVSLFEHVLQRALFRHLAPHFGRVKPPAVHYDTLGQLGREVSIALSLLARFGASDEARARDAFAAGAAVIAGSEAGLPAERLSFLPRTESRLTDLDDALTKLALVAPALKRALLRMAETAVAADRSVTVEEGELLRAIADTIDVPVPPLLPGQRAR